ncbi:hypothetical protein HDC30_005789 [Pseudomonas sp. JAI115]|uniref:hypothetical protein n=1 Tax=Pseudomonas sp. JAI115 TaxID=2723061 RepID=UPI00160A666E|nr:hypothetical protein [Pseudomonas sp. JAI115]MBB6158531.1 hypothetical protein [Pseudomonas sp. JAI115]
MKILLLVGLLALIGVLNVGYYNEVSDGEVNTIFFIKKSPTLRMHFFNIHANDGDYRKVESLSDEYRQDIIDYCKYRLGIETEVKNQADVEMCARM